MRGDATERVAGDGDESAVQIFWRAAGRLLKEERESYGWTQADLAVRAGVSFGLVGTYEVGERRQPSVVEWRKLTAALGTTWDGFERKVESLSGVSLTTGVTRPDQGGPEAIDARRLRARLREMDERDDGLAARLAAVEEALGLARRAAAAPPRTPAEQWVPEAGEPARPRR